MLILLIKLFFDFYILLYEFQTLLIVINLTYINFYKKKFSIVK